MQNIAHLNWFFFSATTCSLTTSNVTSKGWERMTKQVPLYIKMWKTSKNEVTYNSWNQIQDKEKTWKFTKSLREKGFRIQDFWINHFILNLIPRVSSLYDTFDDNEGLLHSHYYWKSERPGDIKLPDRQFLILNENKKHGFVKG